MSLKVVEMKLARLLVDEDTCQLNSFILKNDQVYHAIYKPNKSDPTGPELVHRFLSAMHQEELPVVFCSNRIAYIQ